MAISGGDGSIILTTKVDETGLKKGLGSMKKLGATAGKAFLAIGAAAATATVAITKMATDAYADYEQLVGGVETLFKGSAKRVMAYAENAFYTAGVSANEYMKQVTSFSAALIRSTAGDTDKAADVANMALQDISDNVNKMGSSMESVQLAYQGFARQQYLLLDNLKLGYGGTKEEMERLLRDAEALTGVKYDINNLADVYSAIHAIQEELGITGTTAKEAEKTITGSANMMKAAWQNVLSAVAGGGDLDRAINNLVYSIQKYFENIVPVVERALQGIGQLIERVAPMLVQTVARSLIKAIPSLLNAVYQMVIGLAKGIYQGIIDLFSGGAEQTLQAQTNEIAQSVENQNALTEAVEETAKAQKGALAGFDEINTLTKDSTENQELLGGVGGVGGIGVGGSTLTKTENEVSGFASVMQEQFAKIAKIANQVWDSAPIKTFVKASKTTLKTFWKFATTMWSDIKNNALMTWQNIQGDLQTTGENLVALWTSYWSDFNDVVENWGQPIINSISKLFNSIWSTAIDPAVQLITKAWADFTGILLDLWNEHGATLFNNVNEFVHNIIGLFQSIYDNVLEPIITPFLQTMSSLWDEHISVMIEKVGDFVMKLVNGALEIYNKFIHPIVMWLTETLEPIFTWIGNTISDVFHTIVSTVSDTLGGVFDALGGLIDFIVGVFTGDWERAWSGIKSFFVGIWDAIWGVVKGVINLIIGGLNFLWGGLYGALASIINGVGGIVEGIGDLIGADWGWEIPSNPPLIPKLAQGAVIPPNREFLAVLGDQKSGTNIEAPLDTIKQAVAEVLAQVNVGSSGYNGRIEVPVIINGREIARAVREGEQDMGKQTVFGGFANAY